MVNYTNYTAATNVTGFDTAFDYSRTVVTSATGNADAFSLMVLGVVFIGFWIVGSKYTQERALLYSSFLTTLVAFVLVSGNFLQPMYMLVCLIGLLMAILFANRLG